MNRRERRAQKDVKPAAAPLPLQNRAGDEARESPVWRFIGSYLTLVLIGFIAFRHPSMMVGGNELSTDRAMFTSVNAVTLTGFQQTLALDEYRWPGKVMALLLTMAGTVLTLIAGGMAVARIAKTGCSDRGIIVGAVVMEAFALVVGAVALTGRGRGVFEAIFQGASAFGHSGLALGVVPAATDLRTHAVLIPLALLGGIGIPVLLCIACAIRRRCGLHPYARQALVLWAAS